MLGKIYFVKVSVAAILYISLRLRRGVKCLLSNPGQMIDPRSQVRFGAGFPKVFVRSGFFLKNTLGKQEFGLH